MYKKLKYKKGIESEEGTLLLSRSKEQTNPMLPSYNFLTTSSTTNTFFSEPVKLPSLLQFKNQFFNVLKKIKASISKTEEALSEKLQNKTKIKNSDSNKLKVLQARSKRLTVMINAVNKLPGEFSVESNKKLQRYLAAILYLSRRVFEPSTREIIYGQIIDFVRNIPYSVFFEEEFVHPMYSTSITNKKRISTEPLRNNPAIFSHDNSSYQLTTLLEKFKSNIFILLNKDFNTQISHLKKGKVSKIKHEHEQDELCSILTFIKLFPTKLTQETKGIFLFFMEELFSYAMDRNKHANNIFYCIRILRDGLDSLPEGIGIAEEIQNLLRSKEILANLTSSGL